MKCIIAGSRDLGLKTVNNQKVQMTLDECKLIDDMFTSCEWCGKITEIVSGTARGVDTIGEQLAEKYGLKLTKFPADWDRHGKRAGHLRNGDMAKYTDIAMVFMSCGGTAGSKNMIQQMDKLKKPCLVFEETLEGNLIGK